MAFVFKDSRGRGANWYAGYRDASGKWRKKSTRQTDKNKAKLIAQGFETAGFLARSGTATEAQIRTVMAETIERVTGRKPYDPSIGQWLDRWLDNERGTVKQKTLIRYEQVVKDLRETLGSTGLQAPLRHIPKEIF